MHVAPGATVVPEQASPPALKMKLPLLMPPIVSVPNFSDAEALVFLTVTCIVAPRVPSCCAGNVSDVGVVCTPGMVAVPVRFASCGLFSASSATCRIALKTPAALGVNVTLTVQVAPAASVAPQVWDDFANRAASVPAIVIPEMFIVASPVFWIDSAWGAVVSPIPIAKLRPVEGVKASCGCVPVPETW